MERSTIPLSPNDSTTFPLLGRFCLLDPTLVHLVSGIMKRGDTDSRLLTLGALRGALREARTEGQAAICSELTRLLRLAEATVPTRNLDRYDAEVLDD